MNPTFLLLARRSACLLLLVVLSGPIFAQLTKTTNTLTKEVPLDIELKHSDSKDWLHDMEIVVTNTGEKPIYYLYINLIFDGLKSTSGGYRMGVPLLFGTDRMYSTVALPEKDDPSIGSHSKISLHISKDAADAWSGSFAQGSYPRPTSLTAELGWISFGDATGFTGGNVKYGKKNQ